MPNQPKIELRKISHNERLSEETNCYSADLYVDGVKWGEVGNHGHGGSDHFHGVPGKNYGDVMDLDKLIAATYPKEDLASVGAPGVIMDESLEGLCGKIVAEWLIARDLKKELAKKVLFTKPEEKGLFTYSTKKHTPAQIFAHLEKTIPEAVVLNKLPFHEALDLYRATAA